MARLTSHFFQHKEVAPIGYKGRNIEVVTLDPAKYLITANTASLAVGVQEDDTVIIFPYILGRIKARSIFGELFSVGASISSVNVTIFADRDANGEEILRGIKDELSTACKEEVLISTCYIDKEENKQTGLVINACGVVYKSDLKVASTRPGDYVYVLGKPKGASEISSMDSKENAHLSCVSEIISFGSVHEMFILNGQSINDILEYIRENIGYSCRIGKNVSLDLGKISDAGTCVLFSCGNKIKNSDYHGTALQEIGRIL